MTAYDRVIEALDAHGSKSTQVQQNRSMWQCPAHPDNNPSLEVKYKSDKVILACYAKCQTDDVVAALGLQWSDLFDGDLEQHKTTGEQLVRSYLYERANGDPWFWVDRYFPKTFRQRLPGVDPVRDLGERDEVRRLGFGKEGRAPIPYHAPRVSRALREGGAVVWWLDGEKDVETAERHGLVATCAPGFAKWDERYAGFLRDAAEIVMVVDQDKEKPNGRLGAGQEAAVKARLGFRAVGLKVRVVSPCAGKDLTDHFNAGCGVDDFVPDPSLCVRPRGLKASDLMDHEFTPVNWQVEGLLTSGLTIFAGSPKVGKSWVCLDLACAVATGGRALGSLPARQGSVIYLAREDTYRRLQSRLALIMGGDLGAVPKGLELVPLEVDWVGGEEGLAHLSEWADEVRNPSLVIVDTLAKVEPEMGEERRGNAYGGNYSMMARYKAWADQHNAAVLMVHHDRKESASARQSTGMEADPFSKISGTRGLTGAADTLWFLETVRGTGEGHLHVTGRDVVEQSVEVRKVGPLWTAHDPVEVARS